MKMWISAAMFCGAALLVGCDATKEKPADKPAEAPEVTMPAESTEAPPAEEKPAEEKPMEEAPAAEEKPAEEKPAE